MALGIGQVPQADQKPFWKTAGTWAPTGQAGGCSCRGGSGSQSLRAPSSPRVTLATQVKEHSVPRAATFTL